MPEQGPDALIARCLALGREGMVKEKEELLRVAIARYPDNADLCLLAAVAIWEPAESKELLRRAVRLAPDDPGLLTKAAGVMFSFEEFEETREWVERAVSLASDDFPLAGSLVFISGRLAAQAGDDERAERLLRLAFEREREYPMNGRVLADFYASRGHLVEALRVVSEALRDHPDDETLSETRDRILAQFE
jgi:tetratricopeptide (TPR) repeat protein